MIQSFLLPEMCRAFKASKEKFQTPMIKLEFGILKFGIYLKSILQHRIHEEHYLKKFLNL